MGKITYDWTAKITGSAYSDTAANKITAPHGKVIIAIQAVGSHASNELANIMTKLVAEDSSMFMNSEAAAHVGTTSDVANDGTSTVAAGTAITMTTSYATKGYAAGWYVDGVGVPYGTKVTEVNVGGDALEIKLDNAFVCTDQTIYFTNPNDNVHGTGGMTTVAGTDMALEQGDIIHGRWVSLTVESEDGAGIIAYFGE